MTKAKALGLRRTLAALRAHYTRTAAQIDALPGHSRRALKPALIGKLADLTDRIEKIERTKGVL